MNKEEFSNRLKAAGWNFKTKSYLFERWVFDIYNNELWLYINGFKVTDLGSGSSLFKYSDGNLHSLIESRKLLEKMEMVE